jgi:alpha-1,3-rhamnosyl/mannosyltransferase
MRVLINGICAWDGVKTGVGQYTSGLAEALGAMTAPHEIHCYPPPWLGLALAGWKRCRGLMPGRLARQGTAPPSESALSKPSLKHRLLERHFRRLCARGRFSLYHEPNFLPFSCDVPTVVTIHDLSVLLHPEWHPADRVRDYERRFHRGLTQCRHFLTVSEFTRREVISYLGPPPERVTTTHNGVRPFMRSLPTETVQPVLRRLRLPQSYLLHVGTIEPRKNLLMLLHAYRSLPTSTRELCRLVLVGGWGWNHQEIARFLESEGRQAGVIHVGYLAERDLPAVYNGALALVFPSHYEGFGLPALEMLACGGAVLASTADALIELLAGQAHFINPSDPKGWHDAMHKVITDADWRQSLREGAARWAAGFTWEACATHTLQVYRMLCQGATNTSQHLARVG